MMILYRALSALLSYPREELQEAAPSIAAMILKDGSLPETTAQALTALAVELGSGDLLDLQARYVELFDRSRSLSLHLFEHVHGESRDRGQAMVELRERYRAAGLDLACNELPDYLPLFLEFLSQCPAEESRATLGEAAHVLRVLGERLASRGSSYAAVFVALEVLSRAAPDAALLNELRAVKVDDPNDLAALDQTWEETEVRFGPDAGAGCSQAAVRNTRKPEVIAS